MVIWLVRQVMDEGRRVGVVKSLVDPRTRANFKKTPTTFFAKSRSLGLLFPLFFIRWGERSCDCSMLPAFRASEHSSNSSAGSSNPNWNLARRRFERLLCHWNCKLSQIAQLLTLGKNDIAKSFSVRHSSSLQSFKAQPNTNTSFGGLPHGDSFLGQYLK